MPDVERGAKPAPAVDLAELTARLGKRVRGFDRQRRGLVRRRELHALGIAPTYGVVETLVERLGVHEIDLVGERGVVGREQQLRIAAKPNGGTSPHLARLLRLKRVVAGDDHIDGKVDTHGRVEVVELLPLRVRGEEGYLRGDGRLQVEPRREVGPITGIGLHPQPRLNLKVATQRSAKSNVASCAAVSASFFAEHRFVAVNLLGVVIDGGAGTPAKEAHINLYGGANLGGALNRKVKPTYRVGDMAYIGLNDGGASAVAAIPPVGADAKGLRKVSIPAEVGGGIPPSGIEAKVGLLLRKLIARMKKRQHHPIGVGWLNGYQPVYVVEPIVGQLVGAAAFGAVELVVGARDKVEVGASGSQLVRNPPLNDGCPTIDVRGKHPYPSHQHAGIGQLAVALHHQARR